MPNGTSVNFAVSYGVYRIVWRAILEVRLESRDGEISPLRTLSVAQQTGKLGMLIRWTIYSRQVHSFVRTKWDWRD